MPMSPSVTCCRRARNCYSRRPRMSCCSGPAGSTSNGTVTSVLVPWNTCGAYISGVLGVSTASYLPYCYFNFLSPILDIAYGFLGFKVAHSAGETEPAPVPAITGDMSSPDQSQAEPRVGPSVSD